MRVLVLVLVASLFGVGAWLLGAGRGYEHGKADVLNTIQIRGYVILHKDGKCDVYDKPGQTVSVKLLENARGQFVLLLRSSI